MGILDRLLGRKKAEEKSPGKGEETITELERFLADDKEIYEALKSTMPLDPRKIIKSTMPRAPRKIEVPMEEAVKRAKELEKQKDILKARVWYEVAGGLAIYAGDVKKVKEYFSKCAKLAPNIEYPILKNTERAVQKAQEYYKKYLME